MGVVCSIPTDGYHTSRPNQAESLPGGPEAIDYDFLNVIAFATVPVHGPVVGEPFLPDLPDIQMLWRRACPAR
jgi:hypothetical protein